MTRMLRPPAIAEMAVVALGANFAQITHMPLKLYELVVTDASRPFICSCHMGVRSRPYLN